MQEQNERILDTFEDPAAQWITSVNVPVWVGGFCEQLLYNSSSCQSIQREGAGQKMKRWNISLVFLVGIAVTGFHVWAGPGDTLIEYKSNNPKYIFYFIGDGMSFPQVHAAEAYVSSLEEDKAGDGVIKINALAMSRLPVHGTQMSYAGNRFITGSAAAGTALACGIKTNTNIISMTPDGRTPCVTLAETAKKKGMKVGIVTSVSLDHATPAVFYAHTPSRMDYPEIGRQLFQSGFDYFAGGGFLAVNDAAVPAAEKGFVYVNSRAGFDALKKGDGRVVAVNPYLDHSKSIPYAINRMAAEGPGQEYEGSITLAEFTAKGIRMLDNDNGFFMMVEGGKIDWACHANDARTAIEEVLAFDAAVQTAVEFADRHPLETLIVVTGDHETGGLTLGFAGTEYNAYYEKLKSQKMSYDQFDRNILSAYKTDHVPVPADIDADMWRIVLDYFGLDGARLTADGKDDLSEYEIGLLEEAFDKAMAGVKINPGSEDSLLYGTYNPLSVTSIHLLNNKSGLAWTSYAHTALPVPVFAAGVGSKHFDGYYENTEVAGRIAEILKGDDDF